uniref:hypothetical protein n=1 Tax=Segatella hominis TaxID=2518605 RepID=UPI004027EEE5
MEEKINIAEILKDKPKGTKLYADAFGELSIEEICTEDDNGITLSDNGGIDWLFYNDGKYSWRGESILVPSKEMRDWSKFAWKRGDVLVNKYNNSHIIFDKFNDDTYTTFTGKLFYQVVKAGYNYTHTCSDVMTQNFDIEKGDAVQTYIDTIEKKLGGKLNCETIEVEKAQPEFKDGDVLFVRCEKYSYIEIFNYSKENSDLYDHASLNTTTQKLDVSGKFKICKDGIVEIRLATEEEKKQLFSAFAKEGKAWDAEKKQIVDLKPKIELKPFDKVLVRDSESDKWRANLFGYIDKDEYYHCVYANWVYCIPYAGNEHLLGTTKDVED